MASVPDARQDVYGAQLLKRGDLLVELNELAKQFIVGHIVKDQHFSDGKINGPGPAGDVAPIRHLERLPSYPSLRWLRCQVSMVPPDNSLQVMGHIALRSE